MIRFSTSSRRLLNNFNFVKNTVNLCTRGVVNGSSMDSSASQNSTSEKSENQDDLRSVLVSTVLNLETLDPYLFRATHMWKSPGQGKRLFGGQIIGQAMVAAGKTVKSSLTVHSLHSYFVKAGDPLIPVLYRVHNQRDGGSFCTRTVEAIQNGRTILTMMASYHRYEDSPFQHQYSMPVVPDPDTLPLDIELLRQYADNPELPEKARKWAQKQLAREITFETKRLNQECFFATREEPVEPKLLTWVRVKGYIGTDDDGMDMQHCCLAYISDLFLASIPVMPNRNVPLGMIVSLDHSIWFHTPFRIDEWMLYECESPQSGHGRGISLGRFWRRDGTLAVTVVQESLLRPKL